MAGICHLLAIAGPRQRPGYQFEDALMVCGLAWIVPNLICMWIPETLLVPLGVEWPGWLEILRIMVIPPLWQAALVAVGLRITHRVGWLRAVVDRPVVRGRFLHHVPGVHAVGLPSGDSRWCVL